VTLSVGSSAAHDIPFPFLSLISTLVVNALKEDSPGTMGYVLHIKQ